MADPMTSVEPTCGARSMAHAALQTGVNAPASIDPGQLLLPRAAFLHTLTSLTGGVCQLPLGAPRAREKPSLVGVLAGGLRLATMVMAR
jgi:hypothetical protein